MPVLHCCATLQRLSVCACLHPSYNICTTAHDLTSAARGFKATVSYRVVNTSPLSAAAYAAKFYATEMAFASDSVTLAYSRVGLNYTANYLRTWHETVLYASSTVAPTSLELNYRPSALEPAYRASAAVETVGPVTPCRCSAPQRPLLHGRFGNRVTSSQVSNLLRMGCAAAV